jgi:hypothetical protein
VFSRHNIIVKDIIIEQASAQATIIWVVENLSSSGFG